MYRGTQYDRIKLKYSDIFDGIIGYFFFLVSIGILLYVCPRIDKIDTCLSVILIMGSSINIASTIFWTIFLVYFINEVQSHIKFQKIRKIMNVCSIIMFGIVLIVLVSINFHADYVITTFIMTLLSLMFFRLFNYYVPYFNEEW
jgi:hypothetical protein